MNEALLSSKKMDYCTPQEFFDRLNEEFRFTLDAAATDRSAKCPAYFTPETNGLNSSWALAGGVLYSAILLMGGKSVSGSERLTRKPCTVQPLFCLSRPVPTPATSTTTYTGAQRSAFFVAACDLRTRTA